MSVKNEDGQYPYLMIGEELRYLLKASGVSLKMIADHAGMSNTTIQTLLHKHSSTSMQVTVCKEMNSAKEYHLPAPKEKLSLEAPAVLLTLTPEK